MGRIVSINISSKKGTKKRPVDGPWEVVKDHGLRSDAHSGPWDRQVSLLAIESIEKMGKGPGDFAENLTTTGIDLGSLLIGTELKIGEDVVLKISKIGKDCRNRCAIYYEMGDCVMPREGVFAKVINGGMVNKGDLIQIKKGPLIES